MANNPLSVANTFIEVAEKDGVRLTNMKLQKLMYFAQAHSLSLTGECLIDENPEAWDYGPVFPSVYREFRMYGAQPILCKAIFPFTEEPYASVVDREDREIIEATWDAYKAYTAVRLSEMSHIQDGPWDQARKKGGRSNVISPESISSYFNGLVQA